MSPLWVWPGVPGNWYPYRDATSTEPPVHEIGSNQSFAWVDGRLRLRLDYRYGTF